MKLLFYFGIFLLLFSCSQNENLISDSQKVEIKPLLSNKKMIFVDGGKYQPFYGKGDSLVSVKSFLMDDSPITNGEFLEFVKKNPQWRRSEVKRIYADSLYLKSWISDTELPRHSKLNSPVTQISWFAAKAYAKSVGKRLPTLDEWEYVGRADETDKDASKKLSYSSDIINLYNEKNRQFSEIKKSKPNIFGIYNMFDLVWEWTDDFNSILTTGDSRGGVYDDKQLNCAASAISANDIYNYAAFMRFALRTSVKANFTINNLGFRCAKDIVVQ